MFMDNTTDTNTNVYVYLYMKFEIVAGTYLHLENAQERLLFISMKICNEASYCIRVTTSLQHASTDITYYI